MKEKNEVIQVLKSETSDFTVKLELSEAQRKAAESQRSDLIREKESSSNILAEKDTSFVAARKEWETTTADLRSQLEAANKKKKINPLRPDEGFVDFDELYGQQKVCLACHK